MKNVEKEKEGKLNRRRRRFLYVVSKIRQVGDLQVAVNRLIYQSVVARSILSKFDKS